MLIFVLYSVYNHVYSCYSDYRFNTSISYMIVHLDRLLYDHPYVLFQIFSLSLIAINDE